MIVARIMTIRAITLSRPATMMTMSRMSVIVLSGMR